VDVKPDLAVSDLDPPHHVILIHLITWSWSTSPRDLDPTHHVILIQLITWSWSNSSRDLEPPNHAILNHLITRSWSTSSRDLDPPNHVILIHLISDLEPLITWSWSTLSRAATAFHEKTLRLITCALILCFTIPPTSCKRLLASQPDWLMLFLLQSFSLYQLTSSCMFWSSVNGFNTASRSGFI